MTDPQPTLAIRIAYRLYKSIVFADPARLQPHPVPLPPHLLGIRLRRPYSLRCPPRILADLTPHRPLSSLRQRRSRSGTLAKLRFDPIRLHPHRPFTIETAPRVRLRSSLMFNQDRKSLLAESKNPNQQGGGDNKSLVVMMLVMVAVFFGLQYFRAQHNPQTASPTPLRVHRPRQEAGQPLHLRPPRSPLHRPLRPAPLAQRPQCPPSRLPPNPPPSLRTSSIASPFPIAGGDVTSWILKNYKGFRRQAPQSCPQPGRATGRLSTLPLHQRPPR